MSRAKLVKYDDFKKVEDSARDAVSKLVHSLETSKTELARESIKRKILQEEVDRLRIESSKHGSYDVMGLGDNEPDTEFGQFLVDMVEKGQKSISEELLQSIEEEERRIFNLTR